MPRIEIQTRIKAPIEVVFDLSRSIDAHLAGQTRHSERAVAGRTSGLIELGESVTWEAVHFGIRQRLTSRIVSMNRPFHFRDSMVRGAFQRFDHDHYFETAGDWTQLRDVFDFTSPLGVLGRVMDHLILVRYMTRLLEERNATLKALAESGADMK
jgi:ligand-binding SRPBCC domain-containing protein